jgi:predicted nuclease with RNAse H fold
LVNLGLEMERPAKELCVLGIDLAGVPHRPTGICVLRDVKAKTFLAYSDTEIIESAEKEKPDLVTIDAPLNLPPGRKTLEDRNGEHYRVCDLELRKRKIPFFPITLGPMRMLTVRGIELRVELEKRGSRVAEMYPGGAQDIWRIPRARRDLEGLRKGLQSLGIKGLKRDISDHELDAATGALVGLLFLQDKAEVYGNFTGGAILMPKP